MTHKQHKDWEALQDKRQELKTTIAEAEKRGTPSIRTKAAQELKEVERKINKLYLKSRGL